MNYSDKYAKYFSADMIESVAKTQGDLFYYAARHGYDMDKFIPLYLKSFFCNNEMDSIESYFHWKTEEVLIAELNNEEPVQNLRVDKENTFFDVYWMGEMYRLLVFLTGLSSEEVYDLIDVEAMDKYAVSLELYNKEDAALVIISDNEKFVF